VTHSFPCDVDATAARIRSLWNQLANHLTHRIALDPKKHVDLIIAMSQDEMMFLMNALWGEDDPTPRDNIPAFYDPHRHIVFDATQFSPRLSDEGHLSNLAHECHHAMRNQSLHLSLISRLSTGCGEHAQEIETLIRAWGGWQDHEEDEIRCYSQNPMEVEAICFSHAIVPIPDDRLSQLVKEILAPIDLHMNIPR